MELFAFLVEVENSSAAHALGTELYPLIQYLVNAHYLRVAVHEYIEVAGIGILQRGHAVKLLHGLIGICALFEVYRYGKAVEVGIVANVRNFAELARLYLRDYLFYYSLYRSGSGYLLYYKAVRLFIVLIW